MKLLAIDGNSILNRAFYGIKALTNKNGIPTNAITGFLNTYLMVQKQQKPDFVAIAFDLKAPTFRHKMYDGYKANRKGMPEELAIQMPYIKRIVKALGIPVCEIEGFEADDILGTLSRISSDNNADCVILTGDRDSFQLINGNVKVHLASTRQDIVYDEQGIFEKYGVTPKQLIDVKALMGDSSDNIPGVRGIGEKTALSLIQKYNTLQNIYDNFEQVEGTPSILKKLSEGKSDAFMSRELAEINLQVPVDSDVYSYKIGEINQQELAEILTELDMYEMLKKLNIKPVKLDIVNKPEGKIEKFTIPESDIVMMDKGILHILTGNTEKFIEDKAQINSYLNSEVNKQTFDTKALWNYAFENNCQVKNVIFDTVISAYLLNVSSSDYSVERLFSEYSIPFDDEIPILIALEELNRKLYEQIHQNNLEKILYDIEIPLSEVLASMEFEGIALDSQGVKEFGAGLVSQINEVEQEIYELAGKQFNIQSPKQLGVVLFDELLLPHGKKTKTGYSTNADVLEFLLDKHPIIGKIQNYRTLAKLNSTYVEGLLNVVKPDGKVHTTFRQTETRTGRISSTEPNIQNIPVRTSLGREMRKFFKAQDGRVLVDADYSQIELRVLADISDDENMINAFKNGKDIHTATAAKVLGVPEEWVDHDMRNSAKAVNFGIVYGISAFSLSKDINVSVKEADKYIKEYLTNYSGVQNYMDSVVELAKKNGWVSTKLGRKRFIPELLSKNKIIQAAGKRIAMNTPIQGSAADIIKIAMVKIYSKLKISNIYAKLILQVHDELIVETTPDNVEKVKQILLDEMQSAVELKVPLTVDVNSGNNWYETH